MNLLETGSHKGRMWHIPVLTLVYRRRRCLYKGRLLQTLLADSGNFSGHKLGRGPGVAEWLKRCATSQTVPGSIPGGVTGFFSDIFPSNSTVALGSTQPLVKMSTRNIPGGKGGRCVSLTTSPPSRAECHEI